MAASPDPSTFALFLSGVDETQAPVSVTTPQPHPRVSALPWADLPPEPPQETPLGATRDFQRYRQENETLQQLTQETDNNCGSFFDLENEKREFLEKSALVDNALSAQDPEKIRHVLEALLSEMGKYNDLIGQADLEIEGCKNFLTEIEKLQQSLEKAASVQRKLIEEKVLVRHKCQSFKKLSSDRTSAVSCILNALLCELPLSYCDEARKSIERVNRQVSQGYFPTHQSPFEIEPPPPSSSPPIVPVSIPSPEQGVQNELLEPEREQRDQEARCQEAKRKKMDPEYLEKLFIAQKTMYSLLFLPGPAIEEKDIPVVDLGMMQEFERSVSGWFPKEYSVTRKRKTCLGTVFPHLKDYDRTPVRFRTKVNDALIDVVPLLYLNPEILAKGNEPRSFHFSQNLKIFSEVLKLTEADLQQIFFEWERTIHNFQPRMVSFKKKSPQRDWIQKSNQILEKGFAWQNTCSSF